MVKFNSSTVNIFLDEILHRGDEIDVTAFRKFINKYLVTTIIRLQAV